MAKTGFVFHIHAYSPETIGPIDRQCAIEGIVISLGGRDATVPVKLQDESTIYDCNATRELAKQIAPYIFGQALRFYGIGKWFRNEETGWHMKSFKIESFIVLKETDIMNDVQNMRSISATWSSEAV